MNRSLKGGTVLVVDDQERNIQVVGTTLSALGYEVMAAMDGEQALGRVEARKPDLILLDVLMPQIDGFQICHRLKSLPGAAGIPIIFLSAADDPNMIVRALEAGGVDYIIKPFNKAELLARVRTHIELKRWRDDFAGLVEKREEFMAMMAHDLKNPIGGAHLACEVLAETEITEKNAEHVKKLIATASEGVKQTLELIDCFLKDAHTAQAEVELQLKPIDFATCVADAVLRHQPRAQKKSIRILFEPESCRSDVLVEGDQAGIGRVLDNLLSNAVKFSPIGGEVWVEFDPQRSAVRVRDRGPGFSEEDRERMFESYRRLSARPTAGEPSTGLGLSIAKKLVEAMGGTLKLEPGKKGEGASFLFALPAVSANRLAIPA